MIFDEALQEKFKLKACRDGFQSRTDKLGNTPDLLKCLNYTDSIEMHSQLKLVKDRLHTININVQTVRDEAINKLVDKIVTSNDPNKSGTN